MIIGMAYVWLAVIVLLLIMEAMTTALTTIWFACGAVAAAIAAYFEADLIIQLLVFVCVSMLFLILMRPIALKYMNKNVTKTNVNSLIGKKAIVTKEINNLAQTGQVKMGDIEWKARTAEDGIVIPEKSIVEVEAVNGVKLVVRK